MKTLITGFVAVMLVLPAQTMAKNSQEVGMALTNKQKTIEILNSIETGDSGAVAYINSENYRQHNLAVGDGITGFAEVVSLLPEGSAKVNIKRVFEDGDYVFTHTEYDFFGPKVGFDIFRFEDGVAIEHWDNLQAKAETSVSGRTQTDGPTDIEDLNKTSENKVLVKGLIHDVFLGHSPSSITDYISVDKYLQHNPAIGDGLDALDEALSAMAEAGTPLVYKKNHLVLGEGNFVLAVSEGIFQEQRSSFYDLFRIEGGKIVEHWDTIEVIPPKSEWKNDNGKFGFTLR